MTLQPIQVSAFPGHWCQIEGDVELDHEGAVLVGGRSLASLLLTYYADGDREVVDRQLGLLRITIEPPPPREQLRWPRTQLERVAA